MALPAVVAGAAAAVAAAPAVIEAVKKVLDEFERSVVIEVVNLTDETFRVEGAHHDSGGFGTAPPPAVPPRKSVVFSSRSTAPGRGTVGNLRLVSSDLWLGMTWHNAFVGSNEFRSSENGRRAGEFETYATASAGNKKAPFRYVIYYSDLRRIEQMYPRPQKTWYEANQEQLGKAFLAAETASVSWGPNRIDLFHVENGKTTGLIHRWWDGGAWRSENIGASSKRTGLAAASQASDRLDVFYQLEGELWHIGWDGARWDEDKNLGGNLYKSHGPAAVSWARNRLDVFYRGPDNQLVQRYQQNGRWSGEVKLGGLLAGKPTVASWSANRLDVFFRGDDKQLHQIWWDGQRWNNAELGGTLDGDPAAISWGKGRMDVFYRGPGKQLIQRYYENGVWSGEVRLGEGPMQLLGLSAASWAPRRLDLFHTGFDPQSVVWHHWYQG